MLSRAQLARQIAISTHALREEGDMVNPHLTLPTDISTHALREEGDIVSKSVAKNKQNFYPRPPRGGRPSLISTPQR